MKPDYSISIPELENIEAYLLGTMSMDQHQAFEVRMQTNEEWRKKVDEVKLLLAGIETVSLKERLDVYHEKIGANAPSAETGRIITMHRKFWVAAAVLLLTVVAVWWYTQRETKFERLYSAYYKPDPGLMSAMGIGDNYLFNRAMLDYKTGNYKRAIEQWSQLQQTARHNDTVNYFLGVAEQAGGNSDAAIALLASVASDTTRSFYKDACWYMGLALLKKGSVKDAVLYLQKSGRPESTDLINQIK